MPCLLVDSFDFKQYPDANHALKHALEIRDSGDWALLEHFCANALQCFPADVELSWQLSHSHWMRHDCMKAEAVMRDAARLHPDNGLVTGAIAMYLNEEARYEEAEALYRQAIAQSPNAPHLPIDLADLELRRGAWRDGWTRFEHRLTNPHHGDKSVVTRVEREAPRWRGESLAGRRVVVYSEIGHGDDIQFVRLYPRFAELVRAHGGEPMLAVRHVLHSLIERVVPDCVLVAEHAFSGCDYSIPMMSMPFWLGLMPADIEGRAYLHADAERVAAWRCLLEEEGADNLRVGIVWAGSPTHRRDGQRSIPVDALAPLWRLSNVTFYPVAPGRDGDIAKMRAAGACVVEVAQHYRDNFHDSAALLTALDVLVTIDSSPLHLGGALGRPVLAMIDLASHWCWGTGETQPWYDSVQLLRQHVAGDWRPVVERVADELAQRVRIHQRTAGK